MTPKSTGATTPNKSASSSALSGRRFEDRLRNLGSYYTTMLEAQAEENDPDKGGRWVTYSRNAREREGAFFAAVPESWPEIAATLSRSKLVEEALSKARRYREKHPCTINTECVHADRFDEVFAALDASLDSGGEGDEDANG